MSLFFTFAYYAIVLIISDIIIIIDEVKDAGSWEAIVQLPDFSRLVFYVIILLIIICISALNFALNRIMRPIAMFILARHAGFKHAWIAFVPYGSYYLEFVLPIRDFNVLNWIKTDKRETIAWTYIANDLCKPIIARILGIVPFLGTALNIGYDLLIYMFKWRKIYDLLKTFGFKNSAMTWSILSVIFKPIYVVLLFIMCDKEPDYGYGRFECPPMIDYEGEEIYM